MSKSDKLHKTLAFAAAVAALGTSVGATVESAQAQQGNFGAVQDKTTPLREPGASQLKYETRQKKFALPKSRGGGVRPTSPLQSGITIGGKGPAGATQHKTWSGKIQDERFTGGTKGGLAPSGKQ
ncbi:MAG: hypothetical protein WCA17_14410 [Burkholderiales bacterium]